MVESWVGTDQNHLSKTIAFAKLDTCSPEERRDLREIPELVELPLTLPEFPLILYASYVKSKAAKPPYLCAPPCTRYYNAWHTEGSSSVNWERTKEEKNERPPSQNLEGEAEERSGFEKSTDKMPGGSEGSCPWSGYVPGL